MFVARKFRRIIVVALSLLTIVSTATARYSGGTGEPNDPPAGIELTISSPIPDERFVAGEEIHFSVAPSSQLYVDGSQFKWASSRDGDLGTGLELTLTNLSLGSHAIQVCGYGVCASTSVRIYKDVWELYKSVPAEGEIERVLGDFHFNLIDEMRNGQPRDAWDAYGFVFDQNSLEPSFLVAISKIDLLRHQRFSSPLPFTDGRPLYDHLKTYVKTINLRLDCGLNTGGSGSVNLCRSFSVWDGRTSGTDADPDACKIPPVANPSLFEYIYPLSLLIHEERHSEPGDPGHTMCNGEVKDETLEGGSGYAWSALYMMWIGKYGLYDPPFIRNKARWEAVWFLPSFCSPPQHSDPRVQAIIDEFLLTHRIITTVVRANGASGNRAPIGAYNGNTSVLPTQAGGLMDNNVCFSDRTYGWAQTPVELLGPEYVRTFWSDRSSTTVTYRVTTSRAATVMITVDDRILDKQGATDVATARFAPAGTFVDTGLDLFINQNATNRPMSVFSARLSAGTYVFGAMPSSYNFYTIAASD
jgi:hypothetical protein